ncbi:16S rRNA (guanine(966)-N(2))-methyltransferase RsmD [Aeromicrobium piscarium]|uniref:16S rRNA (Guanine(966)-N(2))-methyltransferase RsmD n=1 Tax=Aeromicrobium piscarium TaxID=2590901 RepID=A0A554S8T7_9ACTN|nr:16S rRNA (guanine(966)-N(2))-methyltransferase RsmD [Aeromicrobium piscarium]TSD62767.1 16S rRNA (guanine(966)-N(2))-methyltransferase RsmD [Aeromicrobium piscarium]
MTRIIAGRWGGRRLATPEGQNTRPTTDRVREAMFSSIASELGGWEGVRVLDLFAGSGALALEALSRGAASADLVESHAKTAGIVSRNARELGARTARVHRMTAERFVATAPAEPYDLVFLDPPYALAAEALREIVASLAIGTWRTEDSLVVVERSSRDVPWEWPEGWVALRDKTYGETRLWYGR